MNYITSKEIKVAELLTQNEDPLAGAVVVFNGTVRARSFGKEVSHLFYEAAEEMARQMIQTLIEEAKEKWQLTSALAIHRVGKVGINETAVVVVTASVHRKEAYEANRFLIEKIKHELPVWKCEYFLDGKKKWGGNCSCQEVTGDPNIHIYE
ncbi:molybdopterin synthase catalytic subunit [Pedobacter sp. UYP30]|uniref:molybdenum cofactor biosynthesis protein MoaE n=1 Tax=Pedobacter sp. UYP30 TaxID=1756400 RepID=UPI003398499C